MIRGVVENWQAHTLHQLVARLLVEFDAGE